MIAIYARVSTQEQADQGYSIEEQIDRTTKYAEALGWGKPRVYTDAGFSGASIDRPALRSLISDVSAHKVSKVLVYKLDRLSRSQKDTLYLIEDVFLANGADFISMSENFDTSTPLGRAMVGILAVFAQLEREQIKERMTMGRLGRAKKGLYTGNNVSPIGYDYQDGKLSVLPFEALQIKQMFEDYACGMSCYAIADKLNEAGLAHRYGKWNSRTVSRCLASRIYLGEVSFGGQWYDGQHDPIIDKELYDQVQEVKQRTAFEHDHYSRQKGKASSYLGGILRCKQCGHKYWMDVLRKNGKTYSYYRCDGRTRHKACQNRHWRMEELDGIIFNEIRKLRVDPSYCLQSKVDNTPVLRKEIEKISDQIDRLISLYAVNDIPVDSLQEKIRCLNEQRSKLESQIADRPSLSVDEAQNLAESFESVLESGDFPQIRMLIESLIDEIVLDGEDIEIHWSFI